MFDNFLLKVSLAIVSAVTALAGLFGIASKSDIPAAQPPVQIQNVAGEQPLGASIPVVVSLFETSLASKISSSDSSMTLVSGSDRNGTALSGYMCFTIDEGTASVEFVCGTASSTAVSSLTRGIDPLTGTTAVTALKKEHRRGATVKITNYPQLAIVSRILNGDDTLPNRLSYVSTIATSTFTDYNLVNKQYVDGVALQGAPTATSTTAGVIVLASGSQLSAGTAMSGAYTLVPPNSFFNFTPQAATTVPVTNASGKLAQGFLDLTQSFTFSGEVTHAATTTLATTTTSQLTVTGTLTVPLTPTSTTDAASKSYVDSKVFTVGSSVALSNNIDYYATSSPGIVVAYCTQGTGNLQIDGYVGNSTSTEVVVQSALTQTAGERANVTFIVPLGKYFKVDCGDDTFNSGLFYPLTF